MAEMTDKELKAQIELRMSRLTEVYNERMKKYRLILDTLDMDLSENLITPTVNPINKVGPQLTILNVPPYVRTKKTVYQRAEELLLEKDTPLIGKEIFEGLGFKNYSSFSGYFSQEYRKVTSNILRYEVENVHVKMKYFYCHKTWFYKDGSIKKEYLDKINTKLATKEAA